MDDVMCGGHRCYKIIPQKEVRSPCSINVALCPDCFKALREEMLEEYKDFFLNIRGFVKSVYEYRPPVDVEAGALPYNTCDYYAMELLMEEIDKKINKEAL